ncbi:MAG: DUF3310 domain-containing protein [Sulfuricaulis sp.]|nr:DUF3310 domain-containing protein [Sulfuricaulis sp.]
MSEWIEWAGGECPVAPETVVEYRQRDGYTNESRAGWLQWLRGGGIEPAYTIVAYRIVPESAEPTSADDLQIAGSHYRDMTVQPWTAMQAWMTPDQFTGFLLGSAIAYLGRFNADAPGKGGLADVRKARHVLDKLIETLEAA